jgi:ABC-type nitrate/sulfonate/bicarbonate transport system substrate-binding protein
VGDYSNGNDAVILKGEGDLPTLAGKPVNLVELSVSHYLLARALDSVGLSEADLAGVVNTSDADMIAAFAASDVQAVVTWNPLVSTILEDPPPTSSSTVRTSRARSSTSWWSTPTRLRRTPISERRSSAPGTR